MACALRPHSSRKIREDAGTRAAGTPGCRTSAGSCLQDSKQTAQRNEGLPRPRLLVKMYEAIIFTTHGPTATIKLNRPDKLNAFGGPMREEILDALAKVPVNDAIRVVV